MLQLSQLWRISSKQFTHGTLPTHTRKQAFRESKSALQASRQRTQTQRANFEMQQELNQQFGSRQRLYARERRSMQRAAEDLMYGRPQRAERRAGKGGQVHETVRDRAEQMATARQLLQMQENTRRLMKKGKTARTETFRAQKQWHR